MDNKQQRVVDGGAALPSLSTAPNAGILARTRSQQRMLRRLMPRCCLLALAVKLDSPGPVLYRQQRIGYRGVRFDCLKFRSMDADAEALLDTIRDQSPADERGKFKLPNDPRRTMIDRFLRRTSLDEIPQLLCVLRGEMSLVGPRPPLVVEYERYVDWEKGRLEMRPGMNRELEPAAGLSDHAAHHPSRSGQPGRSLARFVGE